MTSTQASTQARALRWIGDLDHSFYDDERQRFVWYESSAIGFQLLLLLQYAATGIALLIGGAGALPYLAPMLGPLLVTTGVVVRYSSSRGAAFLPSTGDLTRGRGALVLAVSALLCAGLVRASQSLVGAIDGESGGFWGGFREGISWAGFAMGFGVVIGVVVAVVRGTRERNAAEATDLD